MDLIDGKPGAGKGRFFAELGIAKLVQEPETVILTNFAFELQPWVNGHGDPQIGLLAFLKRFHRSVIGVEKRIYFLTDEQCQEFYTWRVNEKGELFQAETKKNDKGIVSEFDIAACLSARQTMYLVDEAGQMFGSRNWANTGAGVMFYAAQHRKLGDDTQLASQSFKDIDVALVRKCQLFKRCRNRGKLRVGIFRQPEDFKVHVYENPPTGAQGQVPMHTLTFKDDERGRLLLQTFDTTAGVGMRGGRGRGDLRAKKSGIPWKYFLAGMVIIPLVVGLVLNAGMHGLLKAVQHKTAVKLPAQTSSVMPPLPVQNSGVSPQRTPQENVSTPNVERNLDPPSVEKPKKLPLWNLDGDTNLQIVGWCRTPVATNFFLSNGRRLPVHLVREVNEYAVVLLDGTLLPVALPKVDPPAVDSGSVQDSASAVSSAVPPSDLITSRHLGNGVNAVAPQ
jgi:hypothetical protein